MMKQIFSKMHGAGNDFIIMSRDIENRPLSGGQIKKLCDRKRGIGGDGIIFLVISDTPEYDVTMHFYNCDGSRAEMCGNGLRCAAMFAHKTLNCDRRIFFKTDAGRLQTDIIDAENVCIALPVLQYPERVVLQSGQALYAANTGVPHAVVVVNDLDRLDINAMGAAIRYDAYFQPAGTNVNFIQVTDHCGQVRIRTYERGVEGETSACGTGIAAAGISLAHFKGISSPIQFITQDNDVLSIEFHDINNMVSSVNLTGPAVETFTGELLL